MTEEMNKQRTFEVPKSRELTERVVTQRPRILLQMMYYLRVIYKHHYLPFVSL